MDHKTEMTSAIDQLFELCGQFKELRPHLAHAKHTFEQFRHQSSAEVACEAQDKGSRAYCQCPVCGGFKEMQAELAQLRAGHAESERQFAEKCNVIGGLMDELAQLREERDRLHGDVEQWKKDILTARDSFEQFIVWASMESSRVLNLHTPKGHMCDYRNALQSFADKIRRRAFDAPDIIAGLEKERDQLRETVREQQESIKKLKLKHEKDYYP